MAQDHENSQSEECRMLGDPTGKDETRFPEDAAAESSQEGTLWISAEDGADAISVTEGDGGGALVTYTIHLDAPVDHDLWVLHGVATGSAEESWTRIPAGATTVEGRLWAPGRRAGFIIELKAVSAEEGGEPWGAILDGASSLTTTILPRVDGESAPKDDGSWAQEDADAEVVEDPPSPPTGTGNAPVPTEAAEDDAPVVEGEVWGEHDRAAEAADAIPEDDTTFAVFVGTTVEYEISQNPDGSFTIVDMVDDRDGRRVVSEVETFRFADGTFDIAAMEDFASLTMARLAEPEPDFELESDLGLEAGDEPSATPARGEAGVSGGGESFQFGDQTYDTVDLDQLFLLDDPEEEEEEGRNGDADWRDMLADDDPQGAEPDDREAPSDDSPNPMPG
jgi:hypothetical protein